ncbi:MAG: hypothetical protein AB7V14_00585 [Kiritimatiellia bacterium]
MPMFEYRTRMLTRCPACGETVNAVRKHDPTTGESILFCPACGEEIRRTGLQERDTEAEGD